MNKAVAASLILFTCSFISTDKRIDDKKVILEEAWNKIYGFMANLRTRCDHCDVGGEAEEDTKEALAGLFSTGAIIQTSSLNRRDISKYAPDGYLEALGKFCFGTKHTTYTRMGIDFDIDKNNGTVQKGDIEGSYIVKFVMDQTFKGFNGNHQIYCDRTRKYITIECVNRRYLIKSIAVNPFKPPVPCN